MKNTIFLRQNALQALCMAIGCNVMMYLVYISHVHDYWDKTRVQYKKKLLCAEAAFEIGKKKIPYAFEGRYCDTYANLHIEQHSLFFDSNWYRDYQAISLQNY